MARQLPLVTLLTDFGVRGPYVAAMKGAILRGCPQAQIVDITHEIPAHDVVTAAFVLAQAAPQFPPQALHVVVVDPGVGTDRAILAARLGDHLFLVPDNGAITLVQETMPLLALHVCRNTRYVPERASATFHGRDIFAPVAGHILSGLNLAELGPRPDTYRLFDLPDPAAGDNRIAGEVIYVDHFGNLVTNIPESLVAGTFSDPTSLTASCNGHQVGAMAGAYGFVDEGEGLAIFNSMGLVELAVNRGRADEFFEARVGAAVELTG